MADRGWLRFHILFIDNNPAAFQIGIQHQRTYYPEHRGFDSDWKNLCIGTTLFMKVFEELCADPEVDLIDFNPGDADYKLLFADDQQCPEATVYLFAPGLILSCSTCSAPPPGLSQPDSNSPFAKSALSIR